MLADHPDAAHRVERARELSTENLVAGTIVARARSCIRGDQQSLAALADELDAAGCPYQAARTMVLAGGVVRAEGERLLSNLGAAPMPVPH